MKIICILLAVVLLAVLAGASLPLPQETAAASSEGYVLTWSSLDGGGSVNLAGAGYALSGTLAQPDAQTWSSGHYQLHGGFWQEWLRYLFVPLILRN
jgi:hypothetical protein